MIGPKYWWWYYCTPWTVYFDHTRSLAWFMSLQTDTGRAWSMIASCWELQIGTFFEELFSIWKWIFIVRLPLKFGTALYRRTERYDAVCTVDSQKVYAQRCWDRIWIKMMTNVSSNFSKLQQFINFWYISYCYYISFRFLFETRLQKLEVFPRQFWIPNLILVWHQYSTAKINFTMQNSACKIFEFSYYLFIETNLKVRMH